ncbi:MAG: hypothetical protein FJ276_15185 [Planctomycetes bacterium]|nr:hypothetical protein [Planctomycetota bacterium]
MKGGYGFAALRRARPPLELVSKDLSCPSCGTRLRLLPELHCRKIRCATCQTLLRVHAVPAWQLSLAEPPSGGSWRVARRPRPGQGIGERDAISDGPGLACDEADERTENVVRIDASHTATDESGATEDLDGWELVTDEDAAESPEFVPVVTSGTSGTSGKTIGPRVIGWLLVAFLATGLCIAGAILAAPLYRAFRGGVHPQARYLPDHCARFQSIRWSNVVDAGWNDGRARLPGLAITDRCATFIGNAGLEPGDVDRVNVGCAADGSSLLLVYQLTRVVDIEEIMKRARFQAAGYEREMVRGVWMYACAAGGTAIAAPEPRVLINGDTPLVQRVLRRRDGWRDPRIPLLDTLDFSAASVTASDRVPPAFVKHWLKEAAPLADSVRGTVDSVQIGPMTRFARTIHAGDQQSAIQIWQAFRRALRECAGDTAAPPDVRQLLDEVKSVATDSEVRIRTTLDVDALSEDGRRMLALLHE